MFNCKFKVTLSKYCLFYLTKEAKDKYSVSDVSHKMYRFLHYFITERNLGGYGFQLCFTDEEI